MEQLKTIRHKLAILKIWLGLNSSRPSLTRVLLHDMDKLLVSLFIGDKLATKLHNKVAKHHTVIDSMAVLDWASKRFTDSSKLMSALDTAINLKGIRDKDILNLCVYIDTVADKVYTK